MALSQKQIDELAKGNKTKTGGAGSAVPSDGSAPLPKNVKPYNFLNPKRYQREQLKMLDNIFDNMARYFGSQLTSMLRVSCTARVNGVQETKFKEYNAQVGDYSLIGIIELTSEENSIFGKQELMILEQPISFAIMDYMLGGDGSCYNIDREYTDIEMSLLTRLLSQLAPKHNSVWSNYTEMERSLEMVETNLRMVQSIGVDETVVVVEFALNIKDLHGNLHVCFPANTMDALLGIFHTKSLKSSKTEDDEVLNERKQVIMETLKESSLTVTGVLGTTEIHVQELLDLQPGDIFLLNDASKDTSVSLNVEGTPWFQGKIGVHKKNYAIKITEVLNRDKDGRNI